MTDEFTGRVLKYGNGFGFIEADAGGPLVYFRGNNVEGVPRVLAGGDRVAYGDVVVTPKGPSARMVKKI